MTLDEVIKRRESFPLCEDNEGLESRVNIRVDQKAKDIRDQKAKLQLEEYKKNWEMSHRRIKSNRSGILK